MSYFQGSPNLFYKHELGISVYVDKTLPWLRAKPRYECVCQ